MTTLAIIAMIVGGVAVFGGFLVALIKKSATQQGALEERNAETNRSDAAKARADTVLAEHRDPDDAVERLRRHDF